jgi:hypothetical protein
LSAVDAHLPLALRYFGGAILNHMKASNAAGRVRQDPRQAFGTGNPLALFRKESPKDVLVISYLAGGADGVLPWRCRPGNKSSGEFANQHGCCWTMRIAMSHDHRHRLDLQSRRHDAGGRL